MHKNDKTPKSPPMYRLTSERFLEEADSSERMTVRHLKKLMEQEATVARSLVKDTKPGEVPPEFILNLTKDLNRLGEKRASEYVSMNKTILLSDHALKIKQQDLFRLKDISDNYEKMVQEEEEKFDRDVLNFNAFVQKINNVTFQTVSKAVNEGTHRLQRIKEIQGIKASIFELKSDIATMERLLTEYLLCYQFLKSSAPHEEEWKHLSQLDDHLEQLGVKIDPDLTLENVINSGDLEPIKIPFGDADELVKSIRLFRDQNLTIMTNSHYLRTTVKDCQKTLESTTEKMEAELAVYKAKIESYESTIKENKIKENKLKKTSKMFEDDSKDEEKRHHETLAPQVAETYELCTALKTSKLNVIMMVTAIESHLLQLLHDIQRIPEKVLMKVYKRVQWERKLQQKKEEDERRMKAQEERLRISNMRHKDTPKMKLERRLNYRPQLTMHTEKVEEFKEDYEDLGDEHAYFFS